MKKRSGFCLLYTERASAPTAEKERFTGIGWRSSLDMDGAADFQDFANDYYAWFSEKGVEHNDAPKAFVQSILQNTLRIRARILMNGLRLSGVAGC